MGRIRSSQLKLIQQVALLGALVFCLSLSAPTIGTRADAEIPPRVSATVLVIDLSLSMEKEWLGHLRIEAARSAAHKILNLLEQENQVGGAHQVSLVGFSREAVLEQPLTADLEAAREAVDALQPIGRTNIYAGLTVANQALAEAEPMEDKIIILLSDGAANEGPPAAQILSGPVQEAQALGACIYTVGFGEQGDLDEPLLQDISAQSGCGEYYFATDLNELEKTYIRIRHRSSGTLSGEFDGQVLQGQTVPGGSFEAPAGQEEAAVSLWWEGEGRLEISLRDPYGNLYVQGSPGLSLVSYDNLVYALLAYPEAGRWQIEVTGKTIPAGAAAYSMIVSTRAALHTPTPSIAPATATVSAPGAAVGPDPVEATPAPALDAVQMSNNLRTILLVLSALLIITGSAAAIILFLLRRRNIQATGPVPDPPGAATAVPAAVPPAVATNVALLHFVQGPLTGQVRQLESGSLSIGRGSANQLQIPDLAVSRLHAIIRYAQGAWFLQDQRSKTGCVVNGQRVDAIRLNHGDRLQIGLSEIVFSLGPSEE